MGFSYYCIQSFFLQDDLPQLTIEGRKIRKHIGKMRQLSETMLAIMPEEARKYLIETLTEDYQSLISVIDILQPGFQQGISL